MVRIFRRFMRLQHLVMQRNGGYTFIKANVTKLLLSITIILLSFYFFDTYILDIDSVCCLGDRISFTTWLISLFLLRN